MIWSRPIEPFLHPVAPVSSLESPWQLQQLHAPEGMLFRTPDTDAAQTAEELEAIRLAEQEQVADEAFAAGVAEGRAQAEALMREELGSAIDALRAAAASVRENEARRVGALEDNLAALAVCVARAIIQREVRTSVDVTTDLIRRAVTEFPIDETLRVRLHPVDLTALAAAPDGDTVRVAPDREIVWLADPNVQRGGCMVEGRERILDGRVDTALERAYRRITQTVA